MSTRRREQPDARFACAARPSAAASRAWLCAARAPAPWRSCATRRREDAPARQSDRTVRHGAARQRAIVRHCRVPRVRRGANAARRAGNALATRAIVRHMSPPRRRRRARRSDSRANASHASRRRVCRRKLAPAPGCVGHSTAFVGSMEAAWLVHACAVDRHGMLRMAGTGLAHQGARRVWCRRGRFDCAEVSIAHAKGTAEWPCCAPAPRRRAWSAP